ncbi:MAG: hypothetical protein ABIM19_02345 [candidate division WOR-3 bacterium]
MMLIEMVGPVPRGPVMRNEAGRPEGPKAVRGAPLQSVSVENEVPKYSPFRPLAPGDGWIPPTNVRYTAEDEWTPMIAVDANGVLWATNNCVWASYNGYYSTVEICRSTDQGSTWTRTNYIYLTGVDLGDPVIAIDVGRNPNKMYLSFWADYFTDYDMAWATYDISGTSLTNFSSGWLESSPSYNSGPSIAMVERGYATNYAFIAWEFQSGSQYSIRVARTTNYGSSWSILDAYAPFSGWYCGQVWGNAGNNTNPCVLINYKLNIGSSSWSTATVAGLLVSTDRGASWPINWQANFSPNYIFQTASAIGFGTNYVVWAIQVNPNSSDGNIYIYYSTDRCASWSTGYYLENDMITPKDSRMPIVYADGMQQTNFTSRYFYIGFYRETNSLSGIGNYFFKMAPVSSASSASSWIKPPNADTFAIANENQYSVKESNWAQLHLTSFIRNGGYTPGLVWNHEYSSTDHDIHFTRTLDPLYEDIGEDAGSSEFYARQIGGPSGDKLLLEIGLPEGGLVNLTIYEPTGRTMFSDELNLSAGVHRIQKDIHGLSPGVYFLRVSAQMGEVMGKIMVR